MLSRDPLSSHGWLWGLCVFSGILGEASNIVVAAGENAPCPGGPPRGHASIGFLLIRVSDTVVA